MKIALLGEFDPSFEPHVATASAIRHSAAKLSIDVDDEWVSTADIADDLFARFQALWITPGSPYRDMIKTLEAIKYAREHGVPCFGTCGGFQHMLMEYARSVLGISDAQHGEYDPDASTLFISELACSLAGREMELQLTADSRVTEFYGTKKAKERYYCNFAVNPEYVERLQSGQLRICGRDIEGNARVVELPKHPFYVATLFVPQARSTPDQPHPLINAFLRAAQQAQR